MKKPSEQARRDFIRKLIAAEILAKRGQGPLALKPFSWRPAPQRPEVR
ncbi:MAG TPA: hypothetical protein VI299_00705 [Polyangiales bacterium]